MFVAQCMISQSKSNVKSMGVVAWCTQVKVKVSISVISLSLQLLLITLSSTLIVPDTTETSINILVLNGNLNLMFSSHSEEQLRMQPACRLMVHSAGFKECSDEEFPLYSRTLNIHTLIIPFSRLSRLFLQFQFCHEYLLVMIKIRSHIEKCSQKQQFRPM